MKAKNNTGWHIFQGDVLEEFKINTNWAISYLTFKRIIILKKALKLKASKKCTA
jgi:hypothetical protein